MKSHHARGRTGQDRWMVSYADFITLLFAFFVVLYAFAKADEVKQRQVSAAIDSAFHSMSVFSQEESTSSPDNPPQPNAVMAEQTLSPAQVKIDLERIRRELSQSLAAQVAAGSVSIGMGRDGLVISLREAGFFASGSATPTPAALPALRRIAASLSGSPYDVRIEGHTDNVPIHNSEFDSNWELSTARATRIARLCLDLKTIPPDRLSAAGYAEFHPVASNDTEAGRAQNRRVDLVVLPRTTLNLADSAAASAVGPWRKVTDTDR
jgi:chemotaxis protein MotB